jgi:hypothetical protein
VLQKYIYSFANESTTFPNHNHPISGSSFFFAVSTDASVLLSERVGHLQRIKMVLNKI